MKPFNPGLSEQAWNKLHELAARLIKKYGDKLKSDSDKKVG